MIDLVTHYIWYPLLRHAHWIFGRYLVALGN